MTRLTNTREHGDRLTTYIFKVVVEPDEGRWHAYCPPLERHGAATWGATRAEALRHIEEVVRLVIESMAEHGEPIPTSPADQVRVSRASIVALTLRGMADERARLDESRCEQHRAGHGAVIA